MISEAIDFGFSVRVDRPMAETEAELRAALKDEGFGVLTEIDVQATVKEKLGVEFPAYRILGACNPHLAAKGLEAEPAIGLLLPCNVVLTGRGTGTTVSFMDPIAVLGLVDNPAVAPVAMEVAEKLRRVASRLGTPEF